MQPCAGQCAQTSPRPGLGIKELRNLGFRNLGLGIKELRNLGCRDLGFVGPSVRVGNPPETRAYLRCHHSPLIKFQRKRLITWWTSAIPSRNSLRAGSSDPCMMRSRNSADLRSFSFLPDSGCMGSTCLGQPRHMSLENACE